MQSMSRSFFARQNQKTCHQKENLQYLTYFAHKE